MLTKISQTKLFLFFGLFLAVVFGLTNNSQAVNFPLEIINIKPAETGDPAIPSTNRIFRAYPGIEYNIRAAVIGGVYPYTHSLSNAPSGMTINSRTGEIIWPNPQTDATNIQLSVKDSENTTVSTTWSITVSTNGFLFVDGAYSGFETGSITQPYSSLLNLLNNESDITKIVYLRTGVYLMPHYTATYANGLRLVNSPRAWIAYPEESVTMQGGDGAGEAHRILILSSTGSFYFDSIIFKDFNGYGLYVSNPQHYRTIRRCVFNGIVAPDDVNNNYGFLFTTEPWPDTNYSFYMVIQDNEFTAWNPVYSNAVISAIGSLYSDKKYLIENNYIHSPAGNSGTPLGISPKAGQQQYTIRGNKIVMSRGVPLSTWNSYFHTSYGEVYYNLFDNRGSSSHLHHWNWAGHTEAGTQKSLYYYRNTAIGNTLSYRFYGGTYWHLAGPYFINNNVFISSDNQLNKPDENVIYMNNLEDVSVGTIVDSEGELYSSHQQYIGTHGWQFSDGSTPMDKASSLPSDPIPGDINKDGVVNIFDYNIFLQHFGVVEDCQNRADLNGDCSVNIFDYNILLQNFGKSA
jgi:hypothetical protein